MGRPKSDHSPLRRCRACGASAPKSQLERWVLKGDELILDQKQIEPGRGWYSCQKADCSRKMSLIGHKVATSRRHRPSKTQSKTTAQSQGAAS